ncbi:unnamed protein product [Effrenium voratum]|nr:unnamed protein product [Effrenium voratum]
MSCDDMDCDSRSLPCILTYNGCLPAVVLNYSLILVQLPAYLLTSPKRRARVLWALAFFWAFQVLLCFAVTCSGVSIVWCAMLGYSIGTTWVFGDVRTFDHAAHRWLVLGAVSGAAALVYYAVVDETDCEIAFSDGHRGTTATATEPRELADLGRQRSFDVQVLFGDRRQEHYRALARAIIERLAEKTSKPLLLGIHLQDKSVEAFRAILQEVQQRLSGVAPPEDDDFADFEGRVSLDTIKVRSKYLWRFRIWGAKVRLMLAPWSALASLGSLGSLGPPPPTAPRPAPGAARGVATLAAAGAAAAAAPRGARRARGGRAYRWEQGDAADQELRLFLPVAATTQVKDVEFQVAPRSLRVRVAGQPLLEGELWSEADVQDTYFELDGQGESRVLVVYLAKARVETWEEVMQVCYTWAPAGRYNEEIRISVPIREDVVASDVDFSLSEGHLRLALKGQKPWLEGDLWGAVDPEDCDWMIENDEGQRCIVVTLGKLHVREHWDRLLKSEEGLGGWSTFEPGSHKETDLAVLGSLEYRGVHRMA